MKITLVGFRGSGKTSVFNALTGQAAETGFGKKGQSNLGRIQVPDERVDALSAIYSPRKTTYAEIQFVDVAGPSDQEVGAAHGGLDADLVNEIRVADALVHVARGFENPMLTRGPQALDDVCAFEDELILTDTIQVEKRVARLKKEKRGRELELMEKLQAHLEEGKALRRLTLTDAEQHVASGFGFLSAKPTLVVLNQAEDDMGNEPPADVVEAAQERGVELIAMCAPMEAEIMTMEPQDQTAFLADFGLEQPVRTRFIKAAYGLLDLISFLTSGEDEVRAWTIKRGTAARAAAGKIHTDLERSFIRAEVTPCAEFLALGSESKVKEAGKLRLEGKEYVVQDGDILHVRHNA